MAGTESLLPGRRRTMWLTLFESPTDGSQTSVEIAWDDAMTWGRDDFADLYLRTVYGSKRGEADNWADEQIEARRAATGRA